MIKSYIHKHHDYNVHMIPCRDDNYTFVLEKDKEAVIFDSSLYEPVSDYLKENNISLKKILITHHHYDHVDGIKKLSKDHQCSILCSEVDFNRKAVPEADDKLIDNQTLDLLGLEIKVLNTPGHTAGHISFYIESLKLLFCADTLFSLGCGRVFSDGDIKDLFHSLQKIGSLPEDVTVYCAHEYTLANMNFLDSKSLVSEKTQELIFKLVKMDGKTIPTTIGFEKEHNPFLYLNNFEQFKDLRNSKDRY